MRNSFSSITEFLVSLHGYLLSSVPDMKGKIKSMRKCGKEGTCPIVTNCREMLERFKTKKPQDIRKDLINWADHFDSWEEGRHTKLFLYPRIQTYLEDAFDTNRDEITEGWIFEHPVNTRPRPPRQPAPPCIPRSVKKCGSAIDRWDGITGASGRCFDFAIFSPFPFRIVGESKLEYGTGHQLEKDMDKCRMWLNHPNPLGKGYQLDACICVLLDISGGTLSKEWDISRAKKEFYESRIFVIGIPML